MIRVFIWEVYTSIILNMLIPMLQGMSRSGSTLAGQFLQCFLKTKVRDIVIDHQDDNDAFHHLHSHPEVHPEFFWEIWMVELEMRKMLIFVCSRKCPSNTWIPVDGYHNQSIVFSALHSDSACNMYCVWCFLFVAWRIHGHGMRNHKALGSLNGWFLLMHPENMNVYVTLFWVSTSLCSFFQNTKFQGIS